jgi:hypothetical protein
MCPEELVGFFDAASGRDGHYDSATCLAHPQRQPPRPRVLAYLDRHADALHLERYGPRSLLAARLHVV